jgi:hypothetical protein
LVSEKYSWLAANYPSNDDASVLTFSKVQYFTSNFLNYLLDYGPSAYRDLIGFSYISNDLTDFLTADSYIEINKIMGKIWDSLSAVDPNR